MTAEATKAKYAEPVRLYRDTPLSIKAICERTGVGFRAFCAYLSRCHRELILRRHHVDDVPDAKLPGSKGQSTEAKRKYGVAIRAVAGEAFIEYNVSQVAHIFGLSPSSLLRQLKLHYPDVIPRRELRRRELGLADHFRRGARGECMEKYAEAVELLRVSELSLGEVAARLGLSDKALYEHVTIHHKNLVELRELRRRQAGQGKRKPGERMGNWGVHREREDCTAKYAEAIRLYTETQLTWNEIARREGLNGHTLRYYVHKWHPDLVVRRRGYAEGTDLEQTKRYKATTAAKYAPAIAKLRETTLPVAVVAREYGLNADVFRTYLREHAPDIVASRSNKKRKQ